MPLHGYMHDDDAVVDISIISRVLHHYAMVKQSKSSHQALYIPVAVVVLLFVIVFTSRILTQEPSDNEIIQHRPYATLVIAIPTVPRANDYLTPTVESILDQIPLESNSRQSTTHVKTMIVLMNMKPDEQHTPYNQLHDKYQYDPRILFLTKVFGHSDPTPNAPDPDDFNNRALKPGRKVRQQTLDLALLLEYVSNSTYSDYTVLMEDDFVLCSGAIEIIHYLICKAQIYAPKFADIITSYGMNGHVLHSNDLEHFSQYLLNHVTEKPVDHLIYLWMLKKTSDSERYFRNRGNVTVLTYKYNLMIHIGWVSSLRATGLKPSKVPKCYGSVSNMVNDISTIFKRSCFRDDLSPCLTSPQVTQTCSLPSSPLSSCACATMRTLPSPSRMTAQTTHVNITLS